MEVWCRAGLLKGVGGVGEFREVGGKGSGTFSIQSFLGLSSFHLEITLPLAKLGYASEEKLFFSATIVL